MAAYTQDSAPIAVETPLGKDVLLLEGFSGTEELGRLFRFELDLLSAEPTIDAKKIVGKKVSFRVNHGDGTPRWFSGFVSRFARVGQGKRLSRWRAEVVPGMWFMTRTTDCKIWQQKSVPEILTSVFGDHSSRVTVQSSIEMSHAPWDYCVQYSESDFTFVSRLMEQEGISYFFRHDQSGLQTVLTDGPSAWQECRDGKVERLSAFSGPARPGLLSTWTRCWAYRSGRHAERDYNFLTPTTDLLVKAKGKVGFEAADSLELYEYPGEYEKKTEGEGWARLRMEEEEVPADVIEGTGGCRSFSPGFLFRDPDGQKYLLTKVSHTARIPNAYDTDGGTGDFEYANEFTAIPSNVPFRTKRTTRKPVISGAQPAIVVGPPGEEIYPDKYGRVKVQFYWDRYGKNDDKSSCWIRVSQPHAGSGWGHIDLPRIGEEVIVSFYDGDPDRPIITGRVYNDRNMPPFSLPGEMTRTGIKSKTHKGSGYNEISVDDTAGKEQVRIHGQHNMDTVVGNDKTEHVKANRTRKVDNDEHITVGNNKAVSVGTNHNEKVGSNQAVTVGSNQTTSVGANQTNTVASSQSNSVGMTKTESVGLMSNENVGMMKTTNVGVAYSIISGAVMNTAVGFISAEEVGMTKKIIVGSKLEIVVGASKLTMDAGGKVSIEGTEFLFSAKGNVKINGAIIDLN